MTLTSNYNILPNLIINIQAYRRDTGTIYYVATSKDLQGLITDGNNKDELIHNIVEVLSLFSDKEYNIFLNYNKGVIDDSSL